MNTRVVEYGLHLTVPQCVQVVDGVGSIDHPGRDRRDLLDRVRAARVGPATYSGAKFPQPTARSVRRAASPERACVGLEHECPLGDLSLWGSGSAIF